MQNVLSKYSLFRRSNVACTVREARVQECPKLASSCLFRVFRIILCLHVVYLIGFKMTSFTYTMKPKGATKGIISQILYFSQKYATMPDKLIVVFVECVLLWVFFNVFLILCINYLAITPYTCTTPRSSRLFYILK